MRHRDKFLVTVQRKQLTISFFSHGSTETIQRVARNNMRGIITWNSIDGFEICFSALDSLVKLTCTPWYLMIRKGIGASTCGILKWGLGIPSITVWIGRRCWRNAQIISSCCQKPLRNNHPWKIQFSTEQWFVEVGGLGINPAPFSYLCHTGAFCITRTEKLQFSLEYNCDL